MDALRSKGKRLKERHAARFGLFAVLLALLLSSGAVGCSLDADRAASTTPVEKKLTIAYTGSDEDQAMTALTAVVFHDRLGYDVALRRVTAKEAVAGVASGRFDLFQGLWSPEQDELLAPYEDEFNPLGAWTFGNTRASLAAPSYMEIREMDEIRNSGAERALVLSDDAFAPGPVPEEVFEKYDLEPTVYDSSEELREAANELYEKEEPFVMLAYSPNWLNLVFELDYLEGEELLSELNGPATINSIARAGLGREDPAAYLLLDKIQLTEFQIESLEFAIQNADGPIAGARDWSETYDPLVDSWVYQYQVQSARTED